MQPVATLPDDLTTRAFPTALGNAAIAVEQTLALGIGEVDLDVARAMAYATQGGKCLRGFLARESARLHGIDPSRANLPAAAIEALHAYSLIHDDLPCMDDDDVRRGQPTVHVKWDQATAVLAGDALQALAFELIALTDAPAPAVVDLVRSLSVAAGVRGMVGGQAKDIMAETAAQPFDLAGIEDMQMGKTGALLTWSATVGPRMAQDSITALEDYGDAIGLAFQIADDILDIEGDATTVGKAVQKDASAGKATFVSLLGLEAARTRAQDLVDAACDALAPYGDAGDTLKKAAQFIVARNK